MSYVLYCLQAGILCCWILFPLSAPGQPAVPLDLPALIEEVRQHNPLLQAHRLQAAGMATQPTQVSAWPDPMFTVLYQPFPLLTARGTQRTQWRVAQQIPYPGKRGLQREIATLSADIADLEADVLAHDLILQVQHTYYTLYRIQELDRLIAQFQEQLKEFEEAAAVKYEVGTGMQQAILRAQLEHNSLIVRREHLAEQRATALETLRLLVNHPDTQALQGPLAVALSRRDDTLLAAEAILDQRPETHALHEALRRAEHKEALAHKAFRPDLNISLTYFDIGAAEAPPTATGRDAVMIGVGVNVPLFRKNRHARIEETTLEKHTIAARQEALHTNVATQLADLQERLRRQQRQLDLLQHTLIPQAETTLEATLTAYTTGRTDFLNLLDTERMLFTLRTEHIETTVRYLQTTALLARATGYPSLTP